MSEEKFVCPEIQIGNDIMFKPNEDAPETSWNLAKVTRVKRNSATGAMAVDAHVLTSSGNLPKADLRHIGDPSLRQYPPRADSGVFKLAPSQLQLNQIPALMRRMDALEETFKAVMGNVEPDASPNPVGRRAGRPATSGVGG